MLYLQQMATNTHNKHSNHCPATCNLWNLMWIVVYSRTSPHQQHFLPSTRDTFSHILNRLIVVSDTKYIRALLRIGLGWQWIQYNIFCHASINSYLIFLPLLMRHLVSTHLRCSGKVHMRVAGYVRQEWSPTRCCNTKLVQFGILCLRDIFLWKK